MNIEVGTIYRLLFNFPYLQKYTKLWNSEFKTDYLLIIIQHDNIGIKKKQH